MSALTILALMFLAAGPARANRYLVDTCARPNSDGERLDQSFGPFGDPNGWATFATAPGTGMAGSCRQGPIEARAQQGSRMTQSDRFGATWTAPSGTHLVGVSMYFQVELTNIPSQGEGVAHFSLHTDRESLIELNSQGGALYEGPGTPTFARAVAEAGRLDWVFTCNDACSSSRWDWIQSRMDQATLTVSDASSPTGFASGPAIAATTWNGQQSVDIDARDVGSGLGRAVVEVDGSDASSIALGSGACRVAAVRGTERVFDAAQPCPTAVHGAYAIDTASLPQGEHTVRILLEDASGNRTSVFGPVTRRIDAANAQIGPGSDPARRGALNGRGASDDARLTAHWGTRGRRTLLKSGFGRRHVVRGRLTTASGEPIGDAQIDLVTRTTAVNARSLVKRGPATGADGRYSVTLPANVSSRDLTVRYRSHVADTIPVAGADLRLRVRAGVRLRVSPHTARRGQAVRFSGRLLGGPVPRGGKLVVLVVRGSTGPWLRFDVVRTDSRGRFRAGYRFKQPGAARYRFRALSLAEAAYPYLAGGSNAAAVRKR